LALCGRAEVPWKECHVMEERVKFIARMLDGEAMSRLCEEFSISRKTGYKILKRYRDCGVEGLIDRSRRPYRHANQLPLQIETLIVRLKRERPAWGHRRSGSGWRGSIRMCSARSRRCWPANVQTLVPSCMCHTGSPSAGTLVYPALRTLNFSSVSGGIIILEVSLIAATASGRSSTASMTSTVRWRLP